MNVYNHSLPKIFRKIKIYSATNDQPLLVFYEWKERVLKIKEMVISVF